MNKHTEGYYLSEEPDCLGFDLQAGQSWIYPTNYPVRDYQYNIIQKALHRNTLVSLPTGLGKTFIAAVVMYNYYRWYPNGKIIFLAPTRPLVKQQIDACYDIMAIPKDVTAELTGSKLKMSRADIWKEKRVFFATPQVLQNDLQHICELGPKIKCLVFDEAHKAKGNHAYCEVMRHLCSQNTLFRILALSATPGNSIKDVLEVIQNLQISHLEFRTEESLDVRPYVFQRHLETVLVPLGDKLHKIRDEYIQILEKYTRSLVQYKVLQGNISCLTKGKIFMTMKEYQELHKGIPNYNEIMKSLNICVTLYHAYELLVRHGLRGFLNFFEEHINKPLLRGNDGIIRIMDDIRSYLGPAPNIEPLPDGTFAEIPKDTKFGHPKFYKLSDILLSHFINSTNSSRVIVFFEYRESVMEAYALLLQARPRIRPRVFLGQGSGITQKLQLNVVKAFREGECNTLLSTCIGEEGLDVGDVDLIVCFDISNKSPIRMIQRMGRTGRKREGQIVVLVTEGKEQEVLKTCLYQKNGLSTFVFSSQQLVNGMCPTCPKMIPDRIKPKCEKMFITVQRPVLTKNSNLKDILRKISNKECPTNFDEFEHVEIKKRLPNPVLLCNKINPLLPKDDDEKLDFFAKNLEKQRILQPFNIITHSKQTEIFVDLLQYADSKRFNIPITQVQNKHLKQTDIRNMFSSISSSHPELTQEIRHEKTVEKVSGELFVEISNYLSIQLSLEKKCKFCTDLFPCLTGFGIQHDNVNLKDFIIPDLNIFDTIKSDDLKLFAQALRLKSKHICENFDDDFDKKLEEIDDDVFGDSLDEVNNSIFDNAKNASYACEKPTSFDRLKESFCPVQNNQNLTSSLNYNDILSFFKLDHVSDLFVEYTKIEYINRSKSPDLFESPNVRQSTSSKKNVLYESPKVRKSPKVDSDSGSPIISSFERIYQFKQKTKKKLFNELTTKPNLSKLQVKQTSFFYNKDDSKSRCTPKVVDDNCVKSSKTLSSDYKTGLIVDISDVCDLSAFKDNDKVINHSLKTSETNENPNLDITDICDLSYFGLEQIKKIDDRTQFSTVINNSVSNMEEQSKTNNEDDEILKIDDICDDFSILSKSTNKKDATKNDLNISDVCDLSIFGLNSKLVQNEICEYNDDITDVPISREKVMKTSQHVENKAQYSTKKFLNCNSINSSSEKENATESKNFNVYNVNTHISDRRVLTCKYNERNTLKPLKTQKRKLDLSAISTTTNSDDDFEDSPKKPRKQKPMTKSSLKPQIKKPRAINEFILDQAVVTDEENMNSNDESSGEDCYDQSFVNDETEDFCTQIHAEYLRTVKSPQIRGTFKIPQQKKFNKSDIFSQIVDDENDTYINDSFCVETGDVTEVHDLSQLEVLEMKLKKRKKKRNCNERVQKKRIIYDSSDDSS